MSDIVHVAPVDAGAELDRLARRYRDANGPVLRVLNLAGGQAETLAERLPAPVREGLLGATEKALQMSLRAADTSRRFLPDQKPWVNTALATSFGAAGGVGGIPTALAELPLTTTLLLRSIQGAAKANGFDPRSDNVKFDCVQVLSDAGPLANDNGADLGFYSLRMTLTGGAMQKVISAVAPKLAQALGQKLAARTVPVLGAFAGAATNYVYSGYYQDVAHVHFGLRRLEVNAGIPHAELLDGLRRRMALLN